MELSRTSDNNDNDVSDMDNAPLIALSPIMASVSKSTSARVGMEPGMDSYILKDGSADIRSSTDLGVEDVSGLLLDVRSKSGIAEQRSEVEVGGENRMTVVPEDNDVVSQENSLRGDEAIDADVASPLGSAPKTNGQISQVKTHLPSSFELRMLVMGARFKKEAEEMEEWNRTHSPIVSPRVGDGGDSSGLAPYSNKLQSAGSFHASTHAAFQAGANVGHLDFGPNFTPRGTAVEASVGSPMCPSEQTSATSSSLLSPTRLSATERWARVRSLVTRQKKNLDRNLTGAERLAKLEEEEQKRLTEFWSKGKLSLPPIPPAFDIEKELVHAQQGGKSKLALSPEEEENEKLLHTFATDTILEKFVPPAPPQYEESFAKGAENINITVSKIPEEVLLKQKEALDNNLMLERQKILEHVRTKEVDILWREQLARERVIALEGKAHERINIEKEKHGQYLLSKEQELAASFKRAREVLEEGIAEQKATLYQKFGEYSHDEELLARKLAVNYSALPQPIEMRIHFLRAIKTKLPKGCYALMLSQYDRLGGRPLRFQNISSYGIGPGRPAVSRVCKHQGRYFDRSLKVEDSVFALCPPRTVLKPSFVLVLELFELQSHRNPTGDRVVAWAAMPMCNEHLAVVTGKFKLPFLRGEVTPEVEHFRVIEDSMAHDLNTWLCNCYVEIKHLSRDLLKGADKNNRTKGDVESGLGGGEDDLSLEYNYLSKQIKAHRRGHRSGSGGDKMQKKEVIVTVSGTGSGSPSKSTSVDLTLHNATEPLKTSSIKVKDGTNVNETVYPDDYSGNPTVDGLFKRKNLTGAGAGSAVGSAYRPLIDSMKANKVADDDEDDEGKGKSKNKFSTKTQASIGLHVSDSSDAFNIARSTRSLASGPVSDAEDSDDNSENDVEVIERGYESEDEFYMDGAQKGKLAGIETIHDANSKLWAASGIKNANIVTKFGGLVTTNERVVVRRLQSDGPRFDTEVVALPGTTGGDVGAGMTHKARLAQTKKAETLAANKSGVEGWVPLTDPREIEVYSMAIASDPGARRKLLPSVISKSKLRYLYVETFGDLSWHLWGTFDFWVTLLVFVMSIWIRIYVHYIGQYFFLQTIPTPVYGFEFQPWQMIMKYMSPSIETQWEVGVVAIGPATNLAAFLLLACSGLGFYKLAGYMPESGSKFIASYGVASILDPFLVLLVDLILQNYNCEATYPNTCGIDYTSSDCHCFNGDFSKLWYRFEREEGSGITGLFITLILYICTTVLSSLLFYEYMLRVHRDAMILDLWRRIDAPAEEFFIPHDFEISHNELYSICAKAHLWRGLNGETRRLVISNYLERDPYDSLFQENTKHYAIYQYELIANPTDPEADKTVKKSLYRHFLLLPDGSIIEIFEEFSVDLNAHANALANLLRAGGGGDVADITGGNGPSDCGNDSDINDLLKKGGGGSQRGSLSRNASRKLGSPGAGAGAPTPKSKKFTVFKGLDAV